MPQLTLVNRRDVKENGCILCAATFDSQGRLLTNALQKTSSRPFRGLANSMWHFTGAAFGTCRNPDHCNAQQHAVGGHLHQASQYLLDAPRSADLWRLAHMVKLPHRRQFLHLAACAAALPALSRIARAQAYPTRPVRLIVPYAPAG